MTKLIPLKNLKPHEEISFPRAVRLLFHMLIRGLPSPLLIDETTGVILDGHHRHWVCTILGFKTVECVCVNYFESSVLLESRRPAIIVSKQDVINYALRGKKFPPKTTRHTLCAH